MKSFLGRTIDVEVLIRGRVLRECVLTERCLLMMIIFCNEDKNEIDRQVLDFKALQFYQKIETAEKLLKKQYPYVYELAVNEFFQLHEIREFRNLIAHSIFDFDKSLPDPINFSVWEIVKPDDKIQYHKEVKMDIKSVSEMVERIRTVNKQLLGVNIRIEDAFKVRFPNFIG
jgi:hypothetical protein